MAEPSASLINQEEPRPLVRQPWFWAVAGGAAALVAATVVVLATRGGGAAPRPSWQRIEIGAGP